MFKRNMASIFMEWTLLVIGLLAGFLFGVLTCRVFFIPLVGVIEVKKGEEKDVVNMVWILPADEITSRKFVQFKVTQK